MNLIARCPACQTFFRVVPDQLRISDGWVRCGLCGEIFDAVQCLNESGTGPTASFFQKPEDTRAQNDHVLPKEAGPFDQDLVPYASAAVNSDDSIVSVAENPNTPGALTVQTASDGSWASAVLLIKPAHDSDSVEPIETGSDSKIEPVSFMRPPVASSWMLRRNQSIAWWGLSVLLALGLLGQGLYRERDQLAALFPVLKPALVAVCDVLGCHVSPMQDIEHLSIDSATFHQVGPQTFVLRFVVKNNSRHALALPAIELTLTDLTDQPVMRRTFTPSELGVARATVPSAGDWEAAAYLRIRSETSGARAQGYRLLIFYP